jgi:alkylated DNA repair dioxygenase AlkB
VFRRRKRNVRSISWPCYDRFDKPSHRRPGVSCALREGPRMTAHLFAPSVAFERIPMPDAEMLYLARLTLAQSDARVLQQLIAEVPWRCEEVVMWGKRMPQPRLTAWYGDAGASYAYSGVQLHPLPWTPILLDIKARIEAAVGSAFNSVLLNYYRDHRDSVGFHSDAEPELGEQPVIASLSLGEERSFVLRHKTLRHVEPVRLCLASGSLLLMRGDTQRCWRHGVPKESRPCGPRVNLTFRTIVG